MSWTRKVAVAGLVMFVVGSFVLGGITLNAE